jgi:hypothetical protein
MRVHAVIAMAGVAMVLAGLGAAMAQDSTQSIPGTAQEGVKNSAASEKAPGDKPLGAAQGPSAVTPAPGSDEAGRYSFHRAGEGFVRLDNRSGQLSQCGWASTGWSCKPVPDERMALESEIARLQRENVALKQSLLAHNVELPAGMVAQSPMIAPPSAGLVPPASIPDPSAKEAKGPPDADLDRAMGFMKSIWRRLVDMVSDLQKDVQKKG